MPYRFSLFRAAEGLGPPLAWDREHRQPLGTRDHVRPPAIRAIMSGLRLNYCYGQESGALHFPFDAGDHWPAAAG